MCHWQSPVCDGGQWDMLLNLINKYGVMPKKCFPDAHSSKSSGVMNTILASKVGPGGGAGCSWADSGGTD